MMSSAKAPAPRRETVDLVRNEVRTLLEQSEAFKALPREKQMEIAKQTVEVGTYLAEPEGMRLPAAQAVDPYAFGNGQHARPVARAAARNTGEGKFTAQSAREAAAAMGLIREAIDFPNFVGGLIQGVFHAIVQSSIEQMEAYAKLVADVSKTLNQFRDEHVTDNQGRDWLTEQFPDTFFLDVDTGEDGGPAPRVRVRDGVDERTALTRLNELPLEGGPITSLDDDVVEERLVPAARTQLATSRQQLLATMVLMGINRIVVSDGRISAKMMIDFRARDAMRHKSASARFDYGDQYAYTSEGEYESDVQGGESSYRRGKDGEWDQERRDGSYYSTGKYKNTATPILKASTASQTATEAELSTKASLSSQVDVNFKSDYLPLEKMADSFQIGMIQQAAKPASKRVTVTKTPGSAPADATPTAGTAGALPKA